MNKEQIKAFEDRIEMCSSDGWKDFVDEINEFEKSINSVDGVNDLEELYMRKGKMELIRWIQSLKESTRETFEQLKEERNADI